MAVSANPHIKYVRHLYKTLFKLHRDLPAPMQALGNEYLREEFKRHRQIKPEEATVFLNEWTRYAVQLSEQLKTTSVGTGLSEKQLNDFHDSQIGQLYELLQEIRNPSEKADTSVPSK